MDKIRFEQIENYMLTCMSDSAHDQEHVYRVLYTALLIAQEETGVDMDVLVCACLLHDIGRKEQFEDSSLCHARVGSEKAYRFLREYGYSADFAGKVQHCIAAHRFRANCPPESIEAKILFDADKLDAAGAMGVARTLLYQGYEGEPLYSLTEDGCVSDGSGDTEPSFFHEYKFKLEKLYDRFYTKRGRELALQRQQAAVDYYHALVQEARQSHDEGKALLEHMFYG